MTTTTTRAPVLHLKRDTRSEIVSTVTALVAANGCHAIGIRELAKAVGVSQSVVYHYFIDKDALLLEMYLQANTQLGVERSKLLQLESTEESLRQVIYFQLDHAKLVAAVLRYYLYKRESFHHIGTGILPEKATLHVEEVLLRGCERGDIVATDISSEAKVITHAINGYILEYYPYMPEGSSAKKLVDGMVQFMMRSLSTRSKK